jgi:hypothetical protein
VLRDRDDDVGASQDRGFQPPPSRLEVVVVDDDRHACAGQEAGDQQRGSGVPDRGAAQDVELAAPECERDPGDEHERGEHPVQARRASEHDRAHARRRLQAVAGRHPDQDLDPVVGQMPDQLALVELAADVGSGAQSVDARPTGPQDGATHRGRPTRRGLDSAR